MRTNLRTNLTVSLQRGPMHVTPYIALTIDGVHGRLVTRTRAGFQSTLLVFPVYVRHRDPE